MGRRKKIDREIDRLNEGKAFLPLGTGRTELRQIKLESVLTDISQNGFTNVKNIP